MRSISFSLMLLVAGLAGTTACTESLPASPSPDASASSPEHGNGIIAYGTPPVVARPEPESDPSALQKTYALMRADALALISNGEDFFARDRKLREFLWDNRTFSRSTYIEQFVAVHMLREALALPSSTNTEGIDHYTTMLVDNASPEAALLLEALDRLSETWPPTAIRRAARKTVDRAASWLESVCTDCTQAGKSGRDVPENPALALKRQELLEATVRLRKLAGP